MIEKSWLELTTILLDSSSLLILIMLISLVNIGLKWLPSVNRISFFLSLFLFLKSVMILEHFSSALMVEVLYLLAVPLILLVGPLMTDFTHATLQMEKGAVLTKKSVYLIALGYLFVAPVLSIKLLNIEQPSELLLGLAMSCELLFALLFIASSSYYFLPMLWHLFQGSLYSIGYDEPTYSWLKSVWLTLSLIWLSLLYGMYAGVAEVNSNAAGAIISGIDVLVLFSLAISTAIYCKKPHQKESERCNEVQKYQKTGLTESLAYDILNNIEGVMATSKPYLESSLSVEKLASQINTQPQYLSQAINQYKEMNFYELIATYRIEHAKSILTNSHEKNILDIALESGFNAKSSFNNTFKKLTGLTPSQYRKQHSQQS